MSGPVVLADRRFAVRFLGRPGTWLWAAAVLAPGAALWIWAGTSLRGFAGDERTWFLWSGNVVLVLFLATLAFVARKWSVMLRSVRDRGRAPAAMADACWAEIQTLNRNVAKGAYGSDAEILAAAGEVLRRFGVERIERPEVAVHDAGGRAVKFVRLRRREPLGRLEAWLEMHAGVGFAASVGVWFHADGAIRHPLGWVLLAGTAVVLVTGVVLVVLYRTLPPRLASEGGEIPFEEAGVARENHEASLAGVVSTLPDAVRAEVADLFRRAATPDDARRRAADVQARVAAKWPEHREAVRDAVVLAGVRDHLFWTTAAARRIDLQLRLWRWIHVPASVLLFAAIALHVLAVLWY